MAAYPRKQWISMVSKVMDLSPTARLHTLVNSYFYGFKSDGFKGSMPSRFNCWEKKVFFSQLFSNRCISENIWSCELRFWHESSLHLKRSKMRSFRENMSFGGRVSIRSWPLQIPTEKKLKSLWKFNENLIITKCVQMVLPPKYSLWGCGNS